MGLLKCDKDRRNKVKNLIHMFLDSQIKMINNICLNKNYQESKIEHIAW